MEPITRGYKPTEETTDKAKKHSHHKPPHRTKHRDLIPPPVSKPHLIPTPTTSTKPHAVVPKASVIKSAPAPSPNPYPYLVANSILSAEFWRCFEKPIEPAVLDKYISRKFLRYDSVATKVEVYWQNEKQDEFCRMKNGYALQPVFADLTPDQLNMRNSRSLKDFFNKIIDLGTDSATYERRQSFWIPFIDILQDGGIDKEFDGYLKNQYPALYQDYQRVLKFKHDQLNGTWSFTTKKKHRWKKL